MYRKANEKSIPSMTMTIRQTSYIDKEVAQFEPRSALPSCVPVTDGWFETNIIPTIHTQPYGT
jgi:hypothetical protein